MAAFRFCSKMALLSAAGLALLTTRAAAQEVQWRSDYTRARQEAKEKNRPLVLDFGTSHCLWCNKLDAVTFRDATVVQTLNERFIPVKLDADREMKLVQALKISSYPTLVFASPEGAILGTSEGFVDAARFHQQLERALAQTSTSPLKTADAVASSGPVSGNAAVAAPAAIRTTVSPAELEPVVAERERTAHELLALAQSDFNTQQYLCCLERCSLLSARYAGLPEAEAGRRLADTIKADPQRARQACDNLTDRLGDLYLELADNCFRQGQAQQGASYLQRVVASCPGSRQAEVAQASLMKMQPGLAARAQAP